jgi:environmental stress-induced protein Ves
MIHLLDPASFRTVPWKNGGGTATDIAQRLGADGEPDWRVGTAAIDRDGPFSDYAGVTRTFTIIHGAGVTLDLAGEGARPVPLNAPTVFAGAPAPYCRLVDGVPATAFNLLTRDGAARGTVRILAGGGAAETLAGADVIVLFAVAGDWRVTGASGDIALGAGAALVAEAEAGLGVSGAAGGRLAAVAIHRV